MSVFQWWVRDNTECKCRVKIVKYWLFRDSFLGAGRVPPLIDRGENITRSANSILFVFIWNNNNLTWSRRGPGLIWPRQVSVSFWEMETRLLQTWLSVSGLHSKPEYNSILIYQLYKIERKIHCTYRHTWVGDSGLDTKNYEHCACGWEVHHYVIKSVVWWCVY